MRPCTDAVILCCDWQSHMRPGFVQFAPDPSARWNLALPPRQKPDTDSFTVTCALTHILISTRSLGLLLALYRVSIKTFRDYKHLLQENYVEYKHIFLSLFKLVSKMLCHVFIVMLELHNLLVSKWCQWRRKPSVFCDITEQNHQLSMTLSPCEKMITFWSALMCCKKNSWVTFWKKKLYLYFTYSSFLVINVCNQGKTLCSPCIVQC